jgi:uncharacterized protein
MSVPSPCIGHCVLNEKKICDGCFRSIEEIAVWSQLTDRAKLKALAQAAERSKKLARADDR